jgi:4'-phosphopantetheinyl transferase
VEAGSLEPSWKIAATAACPEIDVYWERPRTGEEWLGILSDEELQRYRAFHFERDRAAYLTAHALTRRALSRYADVAPPDWQFAKGPCGKPEIANPLDRRLGFNLSHTHGLVACAVGWECEVGIDVERINREINPAVSFFEEWTLKEAYLKALGVGLTEQMARLEATDDWNCFQIRPTEEQCLAVVVKRL